MIICLALRLTARFGLSHQRSAARFLLLAIGFFSLAELVDGLSGLIPGVASLFPGSIALVKEVAEVSVIACAGLATYFFHRSARLEVTPLRNSVDTDALTGLANHGALKRVLRNRFREARERGTPLSCAIIDVDDFKAYNDSFGHEAGNEVLRYVARTLQDCVRTEDYAARYGGDEFVVLCVAGPRETAKLVDRIRSNIESATSEQAVMPARVTVSAGVACLSGQIESPKALVDAADREMYRSKAADKNTVTVARVPGRMEIEGQPTIHEYSQKQG